LTGPITTHSHPASQAPQTELENVDVTTTPGVISYPVGAYSLKRNYTLKDSNEKEASVVGVIPQEEPSYSHPYSTGDRRSSLNLQVTSGGFQRAELLLLSGESTDGTSSTVEYVVTFPEMLSIGGVRFNTTAGTVEIEINGNIVHSFYGEPETWKQGGADFESIISDAITVRAVRASGLPAIHANEYKLADLGTDIDVAYSGELLTATPIYYLEQLPKHKEFHLDSFAAGTSVIQAQKGYESLWVEEAAKILKMDCYSSGTANINCMVNGVPVFQNPVQTGSGWAYSGLVAEGANLLNPGSTFELSSDASGTNLLVRVWYIYLQ